MSRDMCKLLRPLEPYTLSFYPRYTLLPNSSNFTPSSLPGFVAFSHLGPFSEFLLPHIVNTRRLIESRLLMGQPTGVGGSICMIGKGAGQGRWRGCLNNTLLLPRQAFNHMGSDSFMTWPTV